MFDHFAQSAPPTAADQQDVLGRLVLDHGQVSETNAFLLLEPRTFGLRTGGGEQQVPALKETVLSGASGHGNGAMLGVLNVH